MVKDAEYYRKYRATKGKKVATTQESATKVQPRSATVQPPKTQVIESKGNDKVQPQPSARKHGDIQPSIQPANWQDVSQSRFDGKGRGVPVDGYVLISRGLHAEDENGVVTESGYLTRLGQTCTHGYQGWSCKACL